MSQTELAERAGIPLGTLRRWEQTGHPPPRFAYLTNCALVLGCHPFDFVEAHWLEWTPVQGKPAPAGASAVTPAAEPPPPPAPRRGRHRDLETEELDEHDAKEFEDFLRGG